MSGIVRIWGLGIWGIRGLRICGCGVQGFGDLGLRV